MTLGARRASRAGTTRGGVLTGPAEVDFTPEGWEASEEFGDERSLRFYPDGTIRFRHRCKQVDGMQIYAAPTLAPGHVFESRRPSTIGGSILCPDCGTHGWVRAGEWVGA
jgi:hypothetical protein